jgi:hypothetical protein
MTMALYAVCQYFVELLDDLIKKETENDAKGVGGPI